jgi:hypothetical protein
MDAAVKGGWVDWVLSFTAGVLGSGGRRDGNDDTSL